MKKMFVWMLALCLIVSLAGCGSRSAFHIAGAKKVVLIDGNTGAAFEITDAETSRRITGDFNSLKLQKQGKADSSGWTYGIRWYDEAGKEIAGISCGAEPTSITKDGCVWAITEGCVNTELLNSMMK